MDALAVVENDGGQLRMMSFSLSSFRPQIDVDERGLRDGTTGDSRQDAKARRTPVGAEGTIPSSTRYHRPGNGGTDERRFWACAGNGEEYDAGRQKKET
jgi:hypothetical protein